ncbi:MAG: hypothetical protein ACXADS_11315 [Candidatus Thorarchaeota archaeon]|jgi:hypothetical protein
MTDEEKEEVVDSQKLSKRDKKELQDGACVNCAIFLFIFIFTVVAAMIL